MNRISLISALSGSLVITQALSQTGPHDCPLRFSEHQVSTGLPGGAPVFADFDRDGNLDLALYVDSATLGHGAALFLGDGNGGFTRAGTAPTPQSFRDMATGDFDGDGNTDLAVATQYELTVLLGDGAGAFRGAQSQPLGPQPYRIESADFDSNGVDDLAVSLFGRDILTLMGTTGIGLGTPTRTTLAGERHAITVADFDRDGNLDIVATPFSSGQLYTTLTGDGAGGFSLTTTFWHAALAVGLSHGDFNGDGDLDLAILTRGGVQLALGDATGAFHSNPSTRGPIAAWKNFVADLDSDGSLDVIVPTSFDGIVYYAGNGDGTLRDPVSLHRTTAATCSVGDVDGDGISDIVVPERASLSLTILLNIGPAPASATSYGIATGTAFGIPSLQTTQPPVLGGIGELTVSEPTPTVTTGALLIGRTRAMFPYGNGDLFAIPTVATFPYALTSGTATARFAIPGSGCGERFTFQAIGIDPAPLGTMTPFGLTFSNGVEWTLGL